MYFSLLSKTVVSTAVKGETVIYTVPDDHELLLSHALFVSAGDQDKSRISIGQYGYTDNWVTDRLLEDLGQSGDVGLLMPQPVRRFDNLKTRSVQKLYDDEEQIIFECKTHVGVADNAIYLFGAVF